MFDWMRMIMARPNRNIFWPGTVIGAHFAKLLAEITEIIIYRFHENVNQVLILCLVSCSGAMGMGYGNFIR